VVLWQGKLCFNEVETAVENVIFPNPSTGVFHLNTKEKIDRISIYNTTGNLVTDIVLPTETIDLSGFSAGVYTATIQQNNKVLYTKLIVK